MSCKDTTIPRLFIDDSLREKEVVLLDKQQSHYLLHVLRLSEGKCVFVFNGEDGEWLMQLSHVTKKLCQLTPLKQTRIQVPCLDLHYYFAPLKQARLDYMVQKAVEMGAGALCPVLTQHGQVRQVNRERMRANAIEAAEQCGLMSVPEINNAFSLKIILESWLEREQNRHLIFCDESAEQINPISILKRLEPAPLAVLIGPEGGFSVDERMLLHSYSYVTPISLGPRILRADTAAVAALAIIQGVLGDWHHIAQGE